MFKSPYLREKVPELKNANSCDWWGLCRDADQGFRGVFRQQPGMPGEDPPQNFNELSNTTNCSSLHVDSTE